MKTTTWVAMALAAMAMAGCSVTAESPIKTVAYDFSDRDFYDRSYAPSPVYGDPAAVATADDKTDHAKAKQSDEGDDDDQQVVVIVGHSGKVTIDQGRHGHAGDTEDDAPRTSNGRTVVVNGAPDITQRASAPVPSQPLPSGQWTPQTQPQPAPPPPWQPAPPAGQWQPQAPQATPPQAAPRAPLPAANPGFARH